MPPWNSPPRHVSQDTVNYAGLEGMRRSRHAGQGGWCPQGGRRMPRAMGRLWRRGRARNGAPRERGALSRLAVPKGGMGRCNVRAPQAPFQAGSDGDAKPLAQRRAGRARTWSVAGCSSGRSRRQAGAQGGQARGRMAARVVVGPVRWPMCAGRGRPDGIESTRRRATSQRRPVAGYVWSGGVTHL